MIQFFQLDVSAQKYMVGLELYGAIDIHVKIGLGSHFL